MTDKQPLRVLVCDDSLGFPGLVRSWLDDDPRFTHVGTATGGDELLRLVADTPADAVLLDLVLPDVEDPAALVSALRARRPELRVVMVSSLHASLLAQAANGAGADGYCHKAAPQASFLDSLHGAAVG